MQLTAALRERDRENAERLESAKQHPGRRGYVDPLDHRLECSLGRMRLVGAEEERNGGIKRGISETEYQAGVKWRETYSLYLHSIQSPEDMSDEECEAAEKRHMRGVNILESEGKRVLHAVNAVVVFEEPEELGDFAYTSAAARIGLAALAGAY